jgi:hypothetical protein
VIQFSSKPPLSRWWVQELVEEIAAFPFGESDDAHDAAIWGLLRIRRSGFRIATDDEDEEWTPRAVRKYY